MSRWTQIGEVAGQAVWVARRSRVTLMSTEAHVCTAGERPAEDLDELPGYFTVEEMLERKSLSGFKPNAAYVYGWNCASDFTKSLIPGALYERTFGKPWDGHAPYDMTIAQRDGLFVPYHGSTPMLPCSTALAAAERLQEYWRDLPDESRFTNEAFQALGLGMNASRPAQFSQRG